jgi:hypothetical protein
MNTESRERQDSRVSVRGTFRASLHRAFSCLLSGVCRSVFHLSRRAHIRIEFLNGSSAWRGLGRASPGRAAFRLGFFKRVVGLHQSPLCSRSNSMRHPNLPCYEHTGPFAFRCAALSNRGAGGRAALEIAWTRFSIALATLGPTPTRQTSIPYISDAGSMRKCRAGSAVLFPTAWGMEWCNITAKRAKTVIVATSQFK